LTALLAVEGLTAGYGRLLVVREASIRAEAGAVTALIGGNGAGKTTLLSAVAGLLPAAAGRVALGEAVLDGLPADRRVAAGLALVPEGRLVFGGLSVEDNLRVAAYAPRARTRCAANLARVYALFPRLAERARQHAGTLSGGEQQMLAIGRALMAEPRVLLLDEPTLGLAPVMAKVVFDAITALRAEGLAIVMAEQDVARTLALADRAYLMASGAILAQDTGPAMLARPDVRRAYLGL
jgi:branched-chain amino acid transport system ATP-binding protein